MKILGNREEGSIEDLMKKAIGDPIIEAIIQGRNPNAKKSSFPCFESDPKAQELIKAVNEKVGFAVQKAGGMLVKQGEYLNTTDSYCQFLLALCYSVLNDPGSGALQIAAYNTFKRDDGLFEFDNIHNWIKLDTNAMHAVLCSYCGEENLANLSVKVIEHTIPKLEYSYFLQGVAPGTDKLDIAANAWMALAYSCVGNKEKAQKLLEVTKKYRNHSSIVLDKGNYIEDDCALIVANYAIGTSVNWNYSHKLFENVEKLVKADGSFLYDGKQIIRTNVSCSLALAYMTKAGLW